MAEEKKEKKVKRPTAKKRDIQNEKRRLINKVFKSKVKTAIRSFEKDLSEKNEKGAGEKLPLLYALLDKAVKRNVFKRNKADRLKSKFATKV